MDRVNGETLKRRYRNKYIRAGSKREKTRIIDSFMEATGLRSRGHTRRLLKGRNQKKPHPNKGGRPRVYDSAPLKQALVFMWRNLDYPSSHLLKAAIPTQIQMMKAHGHNIEPEIEALLLKISRSTIERILSPIRRQEKADLHRWRTTRNRALAQKVPIAVDQPRPPVQRVMEMDDVSPETKEKLLSTLRNTDPFEVFARKEELLSELYRLTANKHKRKGMGQCSII